MGVVEWIFDRPWAITREALETILAVAEAGASGEASVREVLRAQGVLPEGGFHAVEAELIPGGRAGTILIGSTAVIPIVGPIFPRANLMTALSGATSVDAIAADFAIALASDEVESILFDIDSPGGEVTGVSDLSSTIFAARGTKPMTAFARGQMASAAYWIGSAVDDVLSSDTAMLGSIGVIGVVKDYSEKEAREGVKQHRFVSSISPLKGTLLDTDEGRSEMRSRVDALGVVFAEAVARNRGTDLETVIDDFGQGGMLVGVLAVAQGLADGIATFGDALVSQRTSARASNRTSNATRGGAQMGKENEDHTTTVEAVRDGSPEVYAAIRDEGRAAGAKEAAEAERARIQGIESIKAPGFEDLIASAKYDPTMTREKVSALILEKQEQQRNESAQSDAADGQELAENLEGVGAVDGQDADASDRAAAVSAMVAGGNDRR